MKVIAVYMKDENGVWHFVGKIKEMESIKFYGEDEG